eukprot:TRINITY_DN5523_c2_g1_i1.p1 TRINITY_DN5523_c2_g1~~TRINITY_DN5523_c2_g1_i1.p1  ORF type:complete len:369 (-),score=61.26 TRINITY_DN5523_c2_g1_i1:261-1367(-)
MESSSAPVPFPLLKNPKSYDPFTITLRKEHESLKSVTPGEKIWINIFRKSVPSFRKRAENDESVADADVRAKKFSDRYLSMLDDLEADPCSHGGPPTILLLCRLRELVLRELGFADVFKKVKAEENAKALALLPAHLKTIDAIEDDSKRIEQLLRGVFAGNLFDLGAVNSAQMFEAGEMQFDKTCSSLVERPWVIDDLEKLTKAFRTKGWKKVVIFCDNAGADLVLGILPLAREFLRRGTKVILAVNEVPAINDITYDEMLEVISELERMPGFEDIKSGEEGARLVVVSSGSDLPVADLSSISPELAYLSDDADLVIMEGMGRGIETNLYTQFKCDSLNIGMVKHQEVADFLGGRIYDCVLKYTTPDD